MTKTRCILHGSMKERPKGTPMISWPMSLHRSISNQRNASGNSSRESRADSEHSKEGFAAPQKEAKEITTQCAPNVCVGMTNGITVIPVQTACIFSIKITAKAKVLEKAKEKVNERIQSGMENH